MSLLGAASRLLPDAMIARMLPPGRSFDPRADVPGIRLDGEHAARLLVGPENSAGQGEAWARAVREHLPADAVALAVGRSTGFRHEAAVVVPAPVFTWSARWQRAHRDAIARDVTHVMIESGRPLLAGGVRGDIRRELAWMRGRGIGVALVWHGSDVRDADRHAADDPLSPYRDPAWVEAASVRASAGANRLLARSSGLTSLVSTPDLLDDVPGARWLPVVVDLERWRAESPPLAHGGPLRVVHAPSRAIVKGTDLVEPIVRRLHAEGVIVYERIESVSHAEMPGVVRRADVVLDQFRLGSYGLAAVEAMAAGRVVIGRLTDGVREHIRAATGAAPPILSSRPEELEALLRRLAADPAEAVSLAETGPGFVADTHDGRRSSRVIADALGLGEAAP